jgi:hypothetical protein
MTHNVNQTPEHVKQDSDTLIIHSNVFLPPHSFADAFLAALVRLLPQQSEQSAAAAVDDGS